MKKIIKLFSLLILFLMPVNVLAASKGIIKAPDKASPDQEISVDIVVNTDVAINGFKGTLTYETSVLELLNIENKNNWINNTGFNRESPISLEFAHNNGITGESVVATLKFKVKKDVSKSNTILNLEATSRTIEDQTIITLDKVSKTIDIKSTNNNGEVLSNVVSGYAIPFTVDSSVTTVNVEATLSDKTATFKEGKGPKNNISLEYSKNTIELIVVAASGDEKKYTIEIDRPDNRGTNNNLKKLIINSNPKLLDFKKSELLYNVTTHKLVTIDIAAEAEDPKATIEIKKPDKLIYGSNEVIIKVTSEKNETKEYKILINNVETDIDTTLKNIELFNCSENLNFEPTRFDYEITYKSKYKDELVIKPIVKNSDEAEWSITDYSNLKAGDKVTITVSAKDGTKNVESYYTITFKRDSRINFFLILSLTIFIVLLVVFIKLFIQNKKNKEKESEIEKTKRLEKVNLE